MKSKKNSNIVKFHKPIQFNLGIVIFFIIFIYVIFHIYTYLTDKNITVYEVTQGSIASNNEYTALALRDENVYYADTTGYIYYYAKNRSKVGAKTICYAIDTSGTITEKLKANTVDVTSISEDDLSEMESQISSFMNGYNDNDFYRVYSFKNDLSDSLSQIYSNEAVEEYESDIKKAIESAEYKTYYAPEAGLIMYSIDGYEDITIDTFTSDSFDQSSLDTENLKSDSAITDGQAIYKIITSDHWNLIMAIDEDMVTTLSDTSYIEIRFKEDDATTWAACSITNQAGQDYLILSLDDSMDRYADDRFLNIELLLDQTSGLKIPNTAITEKTFYTIPETYFYKGDDSGDLGLLVSGTTDSFITPTIYYESEDGFYYVDSEEVTDGTIIRKADSKDTYTVGTSTATLSGVYNVNKGYAVFKQIEILYQTEDYSIIKSGTNYGLALYDHIVLQGDQVNENDIIN